MENSNSLNTGNKPGSSGRKMIRCNSKGRRRSFSLVRTNEIRWYENEIRAKILEIQQKNAQRCAYSVCPTSTNKAKQKLCEGNEILSKAPGYCPLDRNEKEQSLDGKGKDALRISKKRKQEQQHCAGSPKQQRRARDKDVNDCRSRSKSYDAAEMRSQTHQPEDCQTTCSSSCSRHGFVYSQPQYDKGESESEKGVLRCSQIRIRQTEESFENTNDSKVDDITDVVHYHEEKISNMKPSYQHNDRNHVVKMTKPNDITKKRHEGRSSILKNTNHRDDNNYVDKVSNVNEITDVVQRHKAKISNLMLPSNINYITDAAQSHEEQQNHSDRINASSEKIGNGKVKETSELELSEKSDIENMNKKKLSESAYQISQYYRDISTANKTDNRIQQPERSVRNVYQPIKVKEVIEDSSLKLKSKGEHIEENPKSIDGKTLELKSKATNFKKTELEPEPSDLPYTVKTTDLTAIPSDLSHTFIRAELKSNPSSWSHTSKRNELKSKVSDFPQTLKKNELKLKPSDLPHTSRKTVLKQKPSDFPNISKKFELKLKSSDLPRTSRKNELIAKPSDLPHTSKKTELKSKPSDLLHSSSKENELTYKPSDLPHTSTKTILKHEISDFAHTCERAELPKRSDLPHTSKATDLLKRYRDQLGGDDIGSAAEGQKEDIHNVFACPFTPPNFSAPSQPKLVISAVYIKEQFPSYSGPWKSEVPPSYSDDSCSSEEDRSEKTPPPPPPPSASASEHQEVNGEEEGYGPLKKFSFKSLVSTSIKLKALQEKLQFRCASEESLPKL